MRTGTTTSTIVVAVLALCSVASAKPPDTAKIVEHVSAAGVKIDASRSTQRFAWRYAVRSEIFPDRETLPGRSSRHVERRHPPSDDDIHDLPAHPEGDT